ncbi:uncharacterized protein [Aegilops tauschii subsp. strangulata]|uniref:uncharacterized protein n=1 Tax=Aegilops tauschii subsp. strangulata TaxID=200361 RepID=UPI003CC86E15
MTAAPPSRPARRGGHGRARARQGSNGERNMRLGGGRRWPPSPDRRRASASTLTLALLLLIKPRTAAAAITNDSSDRSGQQLRCTYLFQEHGAHPTHYPFPRQPWELVACLSSDRDLKPAQTSGLCLNIQQLWPTYETRPSLAWGCSPSSACFQHGAGRIHLGHNHDTGIGSHVLLLHHHKMRMQGTSKGRPSLRSSGPPLLQPYWTPCKVVDVVELDEHDRVDGCCRRRRQKRKSRLRPLLRWGHHRVRLLYSCCACAQRTTESLMR